MKKLDFFDSYKLISSTDNFKGLYNKHIHKTCKFCLKNSNETTFNSIPHILPELLGKNNYTSNDECDICNAKFGQFETDLANYISPFQTIIGQKTKKKIPIFQSRKRINEKATTIKYQDGKIVMNFQNNLSDFNYDIKSNIFNVSFKKKKFIPINVYKSLVKIGLSLCPLNELENYKKTIEWISLKEKQDDLVYDLPLHLFRTRLTNKYYNKPFAQLFKRKLKTTDNKYEPRLCLIVYSGMLAFQLFIPFSLETENINPSEYRLVYKIHPAYINSIDFKEQKKINIKISDLPIIKYDMNFCEQVEENEFFGISYNSIERIK